jgi:hypothetical protein
MDCERVIFSGHALQRMFQRGIGRPAFSCWALWMAGHFALLLPLMS